MTHSVAANLALSMTVLVRSTGDAPATVASWIPARRATRVDPAEAMRSD